MTEPKLSYVGPYPDLLTGPSQSKAWWEKLPVAFLVVVVLPTFVAAVYFLLIASPMYISEARFIVRSPNQAQPSSIGVALQGVGLSSNQTDAFAVHEYIDSRDGLATVRQRYDVRALLGPASADLFSKYPRFWESESDEGLYKAFKRFVTVGYDSTSGISTLRVKAFSAAQAQGVAETLLTGGEGLVNRLNERSASNAVAEAEAALARATAKVSQSQQALTSFRNRERMIDPSLSARESAELISSLRANLANLQAERSQVAAQAPNSPQLPSIDSRIAAYERQIEAERVKIVGSSESLAPKVGAYEDLVMDRELADKQLAAATAALTSAEQEVRRQQLYLERVVSPSRPDKAAEPRRLMSIFTVFLTTMLAYGVGWLIYAGVREHRQA
ncbi:chain-length determining protein [Brevundimonas sp. GW460-12-10-14-LB2]|uniref:chain-length determining protein n=1 Tax=Brevundimonas sp. GW460-12-10-14-LB2 TaxID=1827469 RepID=UPI0007BCBC8E|nr:chain-length determining protein [Brevundimonas sp. GW460-12-10-14-LB2]ANC54486.1 chain-length determining protein [Brevundimonas sp. GW460-12-10-14-LB2]